MAKKSFGQDWLSMLFEQRHLFYTYKLALTLAYTLTGYRTRMVWQYTRPKSLILIHNQRAVLCASGPARSAHPLHLLAMVLFNSKQTTLCIGSKHMGVVNVTSGYRGVF